MKKFLLLIVFMLGAFSTIADAQVYQYRTTEFAYKQVSYGRWTNWTDWQDSDMLITIDFNSDIVRVYSPMTQTYRIIRYVRNYTDSSGGKQAEFTFIDQDGDRGSMRLRVERNGNSQIYIEFADVMWVYNVIRVR